MNTSISFCGDQTQSPDRFGVTRSCSSMSNTSKASSQSDTSKGKVRQSTTPALRPLAPKPLPLLPKQPLSIKTTTFQTTGSSISRRRSPASCAVCFRIGCQLPTHLAYGNESESPGRTSGNSATSVGPEDPVFTSSYAYRLAKQYTDPEILASRINPVYQLPLGPDMNTPEMHRLYHSWFETKSEAKLLIPRHSGAMSDTDWQAFFLPGLQDPLLCLTILAAAAAIFPHVADQTSSRNVVSMTLLGQAIPHMRERLSQDAEAVSDTTISAATFMWTVHMHFEDINAMESHSASVHAFVHARGGLDQLGFSGALAATIRWVDTVHCLIRLIPCRYLGPPSPDPLTKAPLATYGTYWESSKRNPKIVLDRSVIEVCEGTCRLIEFLEQLDGKNVSGLEYVHATKNSCVLLTQCSVIRAKVYDDDHASKAVCFAMASVQYHCFLSSDRVPSVAEVNLSQLILAIQSSGGPGFWRQELELFIWLLIIIVMDPLGHEAKSWCLSLLQSAILSCFGDADVLHRDWKQQLSECLRKFVWSDIHFESSFIEICENIEKNLGDDSDVEEPEGSIGL